MVGCLTASTHSLFPDQKAGFFGYFKIIDDYETGNRLLESAAEWLAVRGKELMIGPVNLSPYEQMGLLVEGFDQPARFMMPYNPPYYVDFFESAGFLKEVDFYSYNCNLNQTVPDRLIRIARRAGRAAGLKVRQIDFSKLRGEGERFSFIHNEAMRATWGFMPLSSAEGIAVLRGLRLFADPSMILFAEVGGHAVALCMTLPGFDPKTKTARLAVLAVVPEYRFKGLEALLILESLAVLRRKGFVALEISLVGEDNIMVKRIIANLLEERIAKRYRVYRKAIL
ncbi:MAG: N-acetyltransferase [Peptococcaceae bacterium]|nr:MAG: N-acetyltransferase [Peptococcaceae bacterium]